mmetsp:Transcript_54809/g.117025  ORF Transcript_54809/g.117025 Transcript_54809/m.117025 type:complete len:203 (+) Transcript_54809:245-853(+)
MLPLQLLLPPLLEYLGSPRVALLDISEGLELTLVFDEQPFLEPQLTEFVVFCGRSREDGVVSLAISLFLHFSPPPFDGLLNSILLVYSLILSNQVDGEWALLKLSGPPLISVSRGLHQFLHIALPFSAKLVLDSIALSISNAHDLGGLLSGLGTHLQASEQSFALLCRRCPRQKTSHPNWQHLRLVLYEVFRGPTVRPSCVR